MGNETAVRLWEAFSTNHPSVPERCDGVWKLGDSEDYTKWSNVLVLSGLKTVYSYPVEAMCSEGISCPEVNDHYVLLDSTGVAVAVIQILDGQICPFDEVSESFAYKAGEEDRSLETWRENHKPFFKRVLERNELEFSTKMDILCVEFEVVFAA
ncbi:ASCH domain-containing protein [Atopococcus tabaci]|uniref:ASCH domain-containing protein n=1 Tax=Atopococcus tabaci TaxID=269774 RepID=UPI00240902F5|nr:ASCH domain-containing protein [Atopococcus tabaci]